jgi:hypothetical protein
MVAAAYQKQYRRHPIAEHRKIVGKRDGVHFTVLLSRRLAIGQFLNAWGNSLRICAA